METELLTHYGTRPTKVISDHPIHTMKFRSGRKRDILSFTTCVCVPHILTLLLALHPSKPPSHPAPKTQKIIIFSTPSFYLRAGTKKFTTSACSAAQSPLPCAKTYFPQKIADATTHVLRSTSRQPRANAALFAQKAKFRGQIRTPSGGKRTTLQREKMPPILEKKIFFSAFALRPQTRRPPPPRPGKAIRKDLVWVGPLSRRRAVSRGCVTTGGPVVRLSVRVARVVGSTLGHDPLENTALRKLQCPVAPKRSKSVG